MTKRAGRLLFLALAMLLLAATASGDRVVVFGGGTIVESDQSRVYVFGGGAYVETLEAAPSGGRRFITTVGP